MIAFSRSSDNIVLRVQKNKVQKVPIYKVQRIQINQVQRFPIYTIQRVSKI